MSRFALSLFSVIGLALALPACSTSDNPNLEDVATQYSTAWCNALERCRGSATFLSNYTSQAECIGRTIKISDTNEKSVCSQEQWNQCFADFTAAKCCTADADAGADAGLTNCVPQPIPQDAAYPEYAPFSRPQIPGTCTGC